MESETIVGLAPFSPTKFPRTEQTTPGRKWRIDHCRSTPPCRLLQIYTPMTTVLVPFAICGEQPQVLGMRRKTLDRWEVPQLAFEVGRGAGHPPRPFLGGDIY